MLGPFATASRRTPPVLHCHSPGFATVARRLRIDVHNNINDNAWQGTAMAPWNGPKKPFCVKNVAAELAWIIWGNLDGMCGSVIDVYIDVGDECCQPELVDTTRRELSWRAGGLAATVVARAGHLLLRLAYSVIVCVTDVTQSGFSEHEESSLHTSL